MRYIALVVCVLACGCTGIAESLLGPVIEDVFSEVFVFDPSPETVSASRLAFVASGDGSVACYILDGGGSDPIMEIPAKPTGIAVGESGTIFVSTEEGVIGLDNAWDEVDTLPVEVTTVDGVAADAGTVVVAGRTDEGSVVLVYDEMSRTLIGQSEPVPDVTIASITVAGGTAYAVERETGEIVAYDLATPVPPRVTVADADAIAGDPVAIVADGKGSLLVATTEGHVEEFDVDAGEVTDTRYVTPLFAPPVGLAFDPEREHVLLLTADDVVRVIDEGGQVVERRESTLVEDATALAFVDR
jgi:hypothetical protein